MRRSTRSVRYLVRGAALLAASLSVLLAACRPTADGPDLPSLSLVDLMTEECVVETPSRVDFRPGVEAEAAGGAGVRSEDAAESVTLRGCFAGNPGNLLAHVRVDGEVARAILAPPTTTLAFPVRYGRGSSLRFGLMLLPPRATASDQRVRFEVALESGQGTRVLARRTLRSGDAASRQPSWTEIPLPGDAREAVRLVLRTALADPTAGETAAVAAWLAPRIVAPRRAPRRVVLVSLDTVRRDHLGTYSGDTTITPALDRLAREATVFENAYVQAPWTLPSHASMLTGLLPTRHGTVDFSDTIPCSARTLAEVLAGEGFVCLACTGDGAMSSSFGFARGFDLLSEREGIRSPDASRPVFERAARFLAANRHNDVFLFLHTLQFHDPLEPPVEVLRDVAGGGAPGRQRVSLAALLGNRGLYRPLPAEMVASIRLLLRAEMRTIDRHLIGPLVEALKREGMYDSTLLIVTSDHGEELYDHGGWGHANCAYNEVVRVPLIVKLPEGMHAGTRVSANVRSIDIAATILDVLGLGARAPATDGVSLLPVIAGTEQGHRACFAEVIPLADKPGMRRRVAVIQGRYKMIVNESLDDWRRYHDFPPPPHPPCELYDLQRDPLERDNLCAGAEEIARPLRALLAEYVAGGRSDSAPGALDDDTRAALKALGYID